MTARLRLLVAVALATGSAAIVQATAVVVFRTPERIVVASDSLVQQQTDEERRVTLACKVRSVAAGRWWFVLAGYMGGTAPALDLWSVVADALMPVRTLADAKEALVSRAYPAMHSALKAARGSTAFARMYTERQTLTSIVVAGADPTPSVGLFVVVLRSIEPFELTAAWLTCPGTACEQQERLYYGTSIAAGPLTELLRWPRPAWVQRADAAAARQLVAEQINAAPAEVASPIDVLQISPQGATWIMRDPASLCAP